MRIIRLKVEDLEKADISRERRCQSAPRRKNGAESPVPPLLLHVNLHLTTTVRAATNRAATVRELVLRVFPLFLCAAAGLAQTTQGLISGQLVDSVTGRPVTAASVFFSSATSNL